MPHSRAYSWAALSSSGNAPTPQYGKGGAGANLYNKHENVLSTTSSQHNPQRSTSQRHARTRSLPIISESEESSPPQQPVQKQAPKSARSPGNRLRKVMPAKALAIQTPSASSSLLSWLPRMPTPTFNSRHELQRRTSPTSFNYGPALPASPPLTPLTPMTPATPVFSRDFASKALDNKIPPYSIRAEEPVYVLTLRTSDEIAQQMQWLRQRWFPADRLKVPAHVTLFHALPGSRLPQVEEQIMELTQQTPQFEISSGRVQRMRKGVLVNLRDGDAEVRYLFDTLRDNFYEWLIEQDKSCKAHWTIQNKEEDQDRVDEAYWDTYRTGLCLGWATGLVLWNYNDGHWVKEKEFEFQGGYRQRSLSPTEMDIRAQWRRQSS